MEATANIVEGEISAAFFPMEASRLSAVSLRPGTMSENRSVFAVQRTMTWSTLLVRLKSRMSLRMWSTASCLLPAGIKLSARPAWNNQSSMYEMWNTGTTSILVETNMPAYFLLPLWPCVLIYYTGSVSISFHRADNFTVVLST